MVNDEARWEYDAWQDVVADWRSTVGEINDVKYNALVKSIQFWGEHLVALRVTQTADARERAIDDASKAYDATHSV